MKCHNKMAPSKTSTTPAACSNVSIGITYEKALAVATKYAKAVVTTAGKLPIGRNPTKSETNPYNIVRKKVVIIF
jgi:hypothetical protein